MIYLSQEGTFMDLFSRGPIERLIVSLIALVAVPPHIRTSIRGGLGSVSDALQSEANSLPEVTRFQRFEGVGSVGYSDTELKTKLKVLCEWIAMILIILISRAVGCFQTALTM
jgi:hypothetical protein